MMGNVCLLIFFQNLTILHKSFRNTIRMSNSLDQDQAQSGSKLFAKINYQQLTRAGKEVSLTWLEIRKTGFPVIHSTSVFI